MSDESDSVKIARIDEKVANLKQQQDFHSNHDDVRFERILQFAKTGFDKLEARLEKMDDKLGDLWDTKNQQSGAKVDDKLDNLWDTKNQQVGDVRTRRLGGALM